ncbi:unnamed protein product, partial [Prorocentrum cordatum]
VDLRFREFAFDNLVVSSALGQGASDLSMSDCLVGLARLDRVIQFMSRTMAQRTAGLIARECAKGK